MININSGYRWVPIFPAYCSLQGFAWAFEEQEKSFSVDNLFFLVLQTHRQLLINISHMAQRRSFTLPGYLDNFLTTGVSCDLQKMFRGTKFHDFTVE